MEAKNRVFFQFHLVLLKIGAGTRKRTKNVGLDERRKIRETGKRESNKGGTLKNKETVSESRRKRSMVGILGGMRDHQGRNEPSEIVCFDRDVDSGKCLLARASGARLETVVTS